MVSCRYGALAVLAGAALVLSCKGERTPDSRARNSTTTTQSAGGQPRPDSQNDWKALYDSWEYPAPIPDFALIDHKGRTFRLSALDRDHVLMGFIYTRCPLPEACPLTTDKMARVQARWRELEGRGKTQGKRLTLLSITLDPDFDTPERLRAFAQERGLDLDSWIFATGPAELVGNALPSLFNVIALPRAPGDVQHTVKVALLEPGRVIAAEWKDNEFSAGDVIDRILAPSPQKPE